MKLISDSNVNPDQLTVFSYWDGPELNVIELLGLRSMVNSGLNVILFTNNQGLNIPNEVQVQSPDLFVSENTRNRIFSYNKRFSEVADFFRCAVIYETGWTWLDLDVFVQNTFFLENSYIFGYQSWSQLNNAILRFPKHSELALSMLDDMSTGDVFSGSWGSSGPKLLTSTIAKFGLQHLAISRQQLYPIHHKNVERFVNPEKKDWVAKEIEESCTVHLWSELLKSRIAPKDLQGNGSWISSKFSEFGINYSDFKSQKINYSAGSSKPNSKFARIKNKVFMIVFYNLMRMRGFRKIFGGIGKCKKTFAVYPKKSL